MWCGENYIQKSLLHCLSLSTLWYSSRVQSQKHSAATNLFELDKAKATLTYLVLKHTPLAFKPLWVSCLARMAGHTQRHTREGHGYD